MTEAPRDAVDRAAAWLARHGALPALGAVMLVLCGIYSCVFRGELVGDDLTFHLAESARLADCLAAGDFDFWNPGANAGYASAYYYQVIPQLASAIPAVLVGHHLFWFQLSVFLPLVLVPAAGYRGLRMMGATPWQAVVAGSLIAFTIGESRWGHGNDGTFQVGLYTQTWALAAFPLALGHAVRWLTTGMGLPPAIAWGAFVGLCHPFSGVSLAITLGVGVIAGLLLKLSGSQWRDWWIEPTRIAVLGALLLLAALPGWVTLYIDSDGWGGFPHRFDDEVGPGFLELGRWYVRGGIFDHGRWGLLSCVLPLVMIGARDNLLRWLWFAGLVFALLLGLGPHIGKTADDLIPPVRFLGAMQIVFALGIGAGAFAIGRALCYSTEDAWLVRMIRRIATRAVYPTILFWVRTAVAAIAAALIVFTVLGGAAPLRRRVRTLPEDRNSHRAELIQVIAALATQPPGRKQAGGGATSHWWNLLPYFYARVPALLQMGGGGLQASPSYDFLWTERGFAKNAYIYDAPYVTFAKSSAKDMPIGEVVITTEHYEARRLPTPGLVSPVQVTGVLPADRKKAHKAALAWVKGDLPLKDHVLAYAGFGEAGQPPAGRTLRSWRQQSPGDDADLYAEVEVAAPTTFMARESWHPRWHAYLDGAEVPVRRVTPYFMAVDVAAGYHVIALRFERPWWAQVAWLAWPGTVLAAWLVTQLRRRHR